MAYATAVRIDDDSIPVVDVAPLRDGTDPQGVADALHRASQGLGFIYISGHGLPEEVIRKARDTAYRFFRAPADEKERLRMSGSHRGWLNPGGSKMQDDAKVDLKESFLWGIATPDGVLHDTHPLRGHNRWPSFVPELEPAAMTYLTAVHALADDLMRGFALGLGLDREFFLKTADKPMSRASFVYYPPQPEDMGEDQFGVGPHTDFGVLTVLCQDDVGGLQVQDVNGQWITAPPIPGTLVVNVADLLARWTDGAYKSTPHRVVNTSGRERLSLVLAYDPNPETVIDAREVFGDGHDASEPPITCGEYLLWRFGKAFAYLSMEGTEWSPK